MARFIQKQVPRSAARSSRECVEPDNDTRFVASRSAADSLEATDNFIAELDAIIAEAGDVAVANS